MSDFLNTMASLSAERAALVTAIDVSAAKPVVPLVLDQFDVIAEIKDHSPAEGALASADSDRAAQAHAAELVAALHDVTAEGFGHEREVDDLEARTAVLVVDVDARQAHLDHALPQRGVEACFGFEDLAQMGGRALVVQELSDGFLQ